MQPLESTHAWERVAAHHRRLAQERIEALFGRDPQRFERYSRRFEGVLLDFSKNPIDDAALAALLELAAEREVPAWRERLLAGDAVNATEGRAALHPALRTPEIAEAAGDGIAGAVEDTLERVAAFAERVRTGTLRGITGRPFTDVVHIGIGGSDLGPRLLADALPPTQDAPRVRFVSSIDPEALAAVISPLNPETTLFVVATKSGGTRETLHNTETALAWFGPDYARNELLQHHFVGVSAHPERFAERGLAFGHQFPLWDWVGGRYSVWSAVSLPVVIAAGMDAFRAFLDGAASMDRHFRDAPLADNLPVLLALVNVWNTTVCGAASHAVLPYDWRLRRLPDYLQQAVMESNGKGVDRDGRALGVHSAPVVWGRSAIDGQHAFYQFLHQGTQVVPVDLICTAAGPQDAEGRRELVANCLAQSRALMVGADPEACSKGSAHRATDASAVLRAHQAHPGNRPSNTLLLARLDARTLGQVLTLYEHRIFVEAAIWGINPFDQWGVELGKRLAGELRARIDEGGDGGALDGSTAGLLRFAVGR